MAIGNGRSYRYQLPSKLQATEDVQGIERMQLRWKNNLSSARNFVNIFGSLRIEISPFRTIHSQRIISAGSIDSTIERKLSSTVRTMCGNTGPIKNVKVIRNKPKTGISNNSLVVTTVDQRLLQSGIEGIFSDNTLCDELLYDDFVKRRLQDCSVANTSLFIRLSGKKSRSQSSALLRKHLPTLAAHIGTLLQSHWTYRHISTVLHGLQSLCEKDTGYRDILRMMSAVATSTMHHKDVCTAQNIALMLYGLQKNDATLAESRNLLAVIEQMTIRSVGSFTPQNVGNALYGMQRMSSDIPEVRALLSALTPKFESCVIELNDQEISNSLYGMKRMSSYVPEVRILLSTLIPKVHNCKADLNAQAVANSLFGMQRMSSDSPEVRALLSALIPKVNNCKFSFNSQNISNALYGLQGMNSDCAVVCDLLSALVPKIRGCEVIFKAQEVSNALYGLQGMSSDNAVVRSLISTLTPRIRSCSTTLGAHEFKCMLYGMQRMRGDSDEMCNLVSAIVPKVQSCETDFNCEELSYMLTGTHQLIHLSVFRPILDVLLRETCKLEKNSRNFKGLRYKELVFLGQSITKSLPALRTTLPFDEYQQWERIHQLLCYAVENHKSFGVTTNLSQLRAERRMQTLLKRVFEKSSVIMSQDERLFNFFKTAILLRVNYTKDESLMINIQLDDIMPDSPVSMKRARVLRDKYFKSQGVFVHRLDHTLTEKMTGEEIQEWVLSRVADAVADHQELQS